MQNVQPVYFKQLNGLRFLAILLVLLEHWLPDLISFPTGHFGVVVFFVISGFLISRILIIKALKSNSVSKFKNIQNFIIRRALRIFPIYFLILFLGIIWEIEPIRKVYPWFFSYTPNFYIIFHKTWIGVWDHFWTLAVEEQYYLFFPFFIFFLPFSSYLRLFIVMIVIGFLSRLSFYLFCSGSFIEDYWFINYVNPISALDSFGLGGLLAYLHIFKKDRFDKIARNPIFIWIFVLLSFVSFYLDESSEFKHNNLFSTVMEISLFAYLSFFLVSKIALESTGIFGKILKWRPILYLGQISYGMYVYHNFLFNFYHLEHNTFWWFLVRKLPINYQEFINFVPLRFILNFILLVLVASVSWFFIEKPLNNLKNKFD